MRIVIDLGCRSYGGPDDSIRPLVERYSPDVLFGFDPQTPESSFQLGGTRVMLSRRAAWMHSGNVAFEGEGQRAGVPAGDSVAWTIVPCFDLDAFIRALPAKAEKILKVDIEGGEYPLLEHLLRRGSIPLVDTYLVEWHTGEYTNGHSPDWRDRRYYEARYGDRFQTWHDPLHARCCNGGAS